MQSTTAFDRFMINDENGNKIWIFPNLSSGEWKNNNYKMVNKVIFIGFGFHLTNLIGLGFLDENGCFHSNFNLKFVIINPVDSKVDKRINDLFKNINKNNILHIQKKVGKPKNNEYIKEYLNEENWENIEKFGF